MCWRKRSFLRGIFFGSVCDCRQVLLTLCLITGVAWGSPRAFPKGGEGGGATEVQSSESLLVSLRLRGKFGETLALYRRQIPLERSSASFSLGGRYQLLLGFFEMFRARLQLTLQGPGIEKNVFELKESGPLLAILPIQSGSLDKQQSSVLQSVRVLEVEAIWLGRGMQHLEIPGPTDYQLWRRYEPLRNWLEMRRSARSKNRSA